MSSETLVLHKHSIEHVRYESVIGCKLMVVYLVWI